MKKLFILLLISTLIACNKEQIEIEKGKSPVKSVRFTQVNDNIIFCYETSADVHGIMISRYPNVERGCCLDENSKYKTSDNYQYTITFTTATYNMQVDDIYYAKSFCEINNEVYYGNELKLKVK